MLIGRRLFFIMKWKMSLYETKFGLVSPLKHLTSKMLSRVTQRLQYLDVYVYLFISFNCFSHLLFFNNIFLLLNISSPEVQRILLLLIQWN